MVLQALDLLQLTLFITLVDIYNILTNNSPTSETITLTGTPATINLMNTSTSQSPINIDVKLITVPNTSNKRYTLTGTDSLDNEFNNTESYSGSPQTIKIIKGTELTLDIDTTSAHPFIIIQPKAHDGNDTNRYNTGVTYSTRN